MHVVNFLGGLLALAWIGVAADYFAGARRARSLGTAPPFAGNELAPPLSIVLAACNEEEKLPGAFRSLLAQTYPGSFEIVAVDDRSTDATGALLDKLADEADKNKQVVILHLTHLPAGWLGKTHALWRGAQQASGRYLLFTDADIVFAPDALSRAVRLAERDDLDHLVSFFRLDLRGFWENAFGLCFGLLFSLRYRPWHVRNARRGEYLGVGGFNLVRKSAYQAIGTHRSIALEVTDDMELGRRLKRAGFKSDVVGAADQISVRWQEGLSGLMGGLEKNAYAGLEYSWPVVIRSVGLLLASIILPVVGLFAARSGRARTGYGVALANLFIIGGYHARKGGIAPGYALTLPVTTLLLIGVMLRSAFVTEQRGGISWRGTFYRLDALRARALPPAEEG